MQSFPLMVDSPALTAEAWQRVRALWRDLETVPLSDPQRVIDRCIDHALELASAAQGMLTIANRPVPADGDPLRGQRIVEVLGSSARAAEVAAARAYLADEVNYLSDPFAIASAALERVDGIVYCVRDVVAQRPELAGGITAHLQQVGIADRMLASLVFDDDLSCQFILDRVGAAPVFEPETASLVSTYLAGLNRAVRCVVRAYGYVDALSPLTPRERDVLQHLLAGRAEKDIATALGATAQTVHTHVKNIYRKFDVSSRAGLLDLWINPRSPVQGISGG